MSTAVKSDNIKKTRTTCTYCGVGCQMYLLTDENHKVVGVEGVEDAVNHGKLCMKGKLGYDFINHEDRLTTPLIRNKETGKLEPATWEQAYALFGEKMKGIKEKYGSNALGHISSAKVTVEEAYLSNKFARVAFGTHNVDHCARLCHATSASALYNSVGSASMTNSMEDLARDSDVLFMIGSNTTDAHPVFATLIREEMKKRPKQVIVADPRTIPFAKDATVHLKQFSGGDIALINGMMNHIIKSDLHNKEFIENRTVGFEELAASLEPYTPEKAELLCGVPAEDIKKAAEIFAKGPNSALLWGMGMAQHANGVDAVWSLINLSLICGMVGRAGTGVNPLRGQNNVQGASDAGALMNYYPGYQLVTDPAVKEKFEKAWGVPMPDTKNGLTMTEMTEEGKGIKGLYILGQNIAATGANNDKAIEALKSLEFLVVQDIFLTETAALADLVLPAASFAEKYGTLTNTERRLQFVNPAIPLPGEAREDLYILLDLFKVMGFPQDHLNGSEDVMREIASVSPIHEGVTYEKITKQNGLVWPIKKDEEQGTLILHSKEFPRFGKANLKPISYSPPMEETCEDYPTILTTGRLLSQHHSMTMTNKTPSLMRVGGQSFMEIHPDDAQKFNIADSEEVRITSRRGSIVTKAKVTEGIKKGVVFVPFHHTGENSINKVTNNAYDPLAKEPEFKVCAVKVEKAS